MRQGSFGTFADSLKQVAQQGAPETAAEALKLAARYRDTFGVPRGPLGRREQLIEEEIMARAAEEDAALPGDD